MGFEFCIVQKLGLVPLRKTKIYGFDQILLKTKTKQFLHKMPVREITVKIQKIGHVVKLLFLFFINSVNFLKLLCSVSELFYIF